MSTLSVENLQHPSSSNANITLDSNGNINLGAGSASLPSITAQGDTNTGIYFPAADNIGFATGGTIRGRWTDNGLCFGTDTAAANALDDYEEGTWTPTDASGAGLSFTVVSADYVKIGRTVTINTYFVWPSTANGNAAAWNLPFTINGYSGTTTFSNLGSQVMLYFPNGGTTVYLRTNNNSDITNATFSGKYIFATFTYFV